MAPQQLGIGIRRHFTRPGVDPYDTVEWERRDARIPNFKDGGDAFFQPDVEFPTSWSLNATNIVAQKYFRGTLGTAEREWSLRQVIDRVADTITDWGIRDGYFVDGNEAETFRDELKYVLVHQRAAFNSPVWFNIGVKGVPQQASACQPYDSLVATTDGFVQIGKLVEDNAIGTKVFDAQGITRIVAVKANGVKTVLRVHTKDGTKLEVTPDHLVWRTRRGTSGWVEAAQLRPGDRLQWHGLDGLGNALVPTGEIRVLEIARVQVIGELPVYDIQTESGEYLSDHLRVHNCFILSVDDTMDSILNWYREEGVIFKGGSGAGVNLSRIRSSREHLNGGGTASGPVSFMRGADASAGTIKSGGKTRRAAKMVILDADHPDVEDFIWCKAIEERKARALAEAGFDMDLDGRDSHSIQYQNANNSVRVTDEFMQAVIDDRDWALRAVTDGQPVKTMKARDLMRQIGQSAWECADPGMQFDTTINRWHTASNTGRINASNPCFPGDTLVHTDKGLVRFDALLKRAQAGETFGVYTHDATNPDAPAERLEITRPEAIMVTGWNEIVKLRFSNGMELRCTPAHRIFTENRGYVEAKDLTADDEIKVLTLPAPATQAEWKLPVTAKLAALAARGDKVSRTFTLPEKWSIELGHYLGWLVGDGCMSGDLVSTIYGSEEEQREILPLHRALATEWNDGVAPTPSVQTNGTVQLRQSRRAIRRFLEFLGVSPKKAAEKVVPKAIHEAPPEVLAAFLRGLFDSDGCVYDGENSRYVGLGSASRELLVGVQRLLTTFGIFSRIYATRASGRAFDYTRKDGTHVTYEGHPLFDLRVSNRSIARFAEHIGFALSSKSTKLAHLIATRRLNETKETVRLVECVEDGVALTYNLCEPRNHSYVVNGTIVANCSEYMHLDNSACNLASINLLTFLQDDGAFDVGGFTRTVEVMFTAQEILVGNADYPTERIAETSRTFRQLGLGYANLGALLMAQGLPYDSDDGRAWASAITALDDRSRLRNKCAYRGAHGSVRGLRRERRADVERAADAPRRGRQDQRRPRAAGTSVRRAGVVGRGRRAWGASWGTKFAIHSFSTNRDNWAHDGLRHNGDRARSRIDEGEEARRWRHDVHRQSDRPARVADARIHRRAGRQDRRVHRRAQDDRRRARVQGRAPAGVRVLDGRQHDPLHGSHPDDGGRPAVDQRRDLEDRESSRRRECRGGRAGLHRVVAARLEGCRPVPRQLQSGPAARDAEEGRRRGYARGRADCRDRHRPGAGAAEAAEGALRKDVLVPGCRLPRLRDGGRVRGRPSW